MSCRARTPCHSSGANHLYWHCHGYTRPVPPPLPPKDHRAVDPRPVPAADRRPRRALCLRGRPGKLAQRRLVVDRQPAGGRGRAGGARAGHVRPHRRLEGRVLGALLGRGQARERARPGGATTWSAGAIRCGSTAGRPDGRWFGNEPQVVLDLHGAAPRQAPSRRSRPRSRTINTPTPATTASGPGPNSNTFVATVLRAIPEAGAILPANAVGRDFRPLPYAGLTDSGTGVEASLWGVLGVKLGWVEGVEMQFPRPRRRPRPAPSRHQAAGLRPHRLAARDGDCRAEQRLGHAAQQHQPADDHQRRDDARRRAAAPSGSPPRSCAPNSTLVSRSAATMAIGATVIAQIAML